MRPVGGLYGINNERPPMGEPNDALGITDASGCLVLHGGCLWILTAGHVVSTVPDIILVDDLKMETLCRVDRLLLWDGPDGRHGRDLARLTPVRVPSLQQLVLADAMPEQGTLVDWWGTADDWKPETARVELELAGIEGSDTEGFGCFARPAGYREGDSGGPILDLAGKLIGISQGQKHGKAIFSPLWMLRELFLG